MKSKKFQHNNEAFNCFHCGHQVPVHPSSCRDHCNHCLYGQHVDINPGDRANPCRGVLEPVGLLVRSNKHQIIYQCQSCHQQILNTAASDDEPDKLVELSSTPVRLKS